MTVCVTAYLRRTSSALYAPVCYKQYCLKVSLQRYGSLRCCFCHTGKI